MTSILNTWTGVLRSQALSVECAKRMERRCGACFLCVSLYVLRVSRVVSKLSCCYRTHSRSHSKTQLISGSTFSTGMEAGSAADILLKERAEKRERVGTFGLASFQVLSALGNKGHE